MKIGIVTEYFPRSEKFEIRGGAEGCAFNEALYLSKNHDVIVLTSREKGMPPSYKIGKIKVITCGLERKYTQSGSFFKRIIFMIDAYLKSRKFDFDIVIGYNFITHSIAWLISKSKGIPVVARYHDVWIGEWTKNIGISGIFGEFLERFNLSRNFDAIFAVSNYTKNKLKKYADSNKIEVIPNIVDINVPEVDKSNNPTIVCVSRLVKYKRVEDLIRAIHIIKKDIPNIRCKIVGTGPMLNYLKELTKKLNVEKNIEFCGFIEKHEDVLKIIKSAHVFCIPSIVEGFGIVVIEAMGCQVPFVATKIPAIVESTGMKGGLFFKPTDYVDLANKIKKILTNKRLYTKLKKECKDKYKEYSRDNIGKILEMKLKEILSKPKK